MLQSPWNRHLGHLTGLSLVTGLEHYTTSRKMHPPGRSTNLPASKSPNAAFSKEFDYPAFPLPIWSPRLLFRTQVPWGPHFYSVSPGHSVTRGDLRHLTLAATVLNLATGRSNISSLLPFLNPSWTWSARPRATRDPSLHSLIPSWIHSSNKVCTRHCAGHQGLTDEEEWSLSGAQYPEDRSLLLEGLEPPWPIGHRQFPRTHQPH